MDKWFELVSEANEVSETTKVQIRAVPLQSEWTR